MPTPQIVEGHAPFRDYATWYRVTGDLAGPKAPLVVLHGGPGCTHDYVDSLKGIAATGRAVVHYDQLGNGRSTHLRDKGADFWTVELFLDELANLTRHLGHRRRLPRVRPVLGRHAGGGARRHPAGGPALAGHRQLPGLDGAVGRARPTGCASSCRRRCRRRCSRTRRPGTTSTPEYTAAVRVFYDRHVCRVNPWPDEVARTFAAIEDDPTVYMTMNGPSEFHVIGTLKHWSIIDRLDRIEVPILLISGRHDEATPATVQPYADHIKDVRWEIFENSSHMPHVEETERCLQVVGDFLDRNDR